MDECEKRKRVENQFDAYCKKVIRNEVYSINRQNQRKSKLETSLENLHADYHVDLSTRDDYPSLQYNFFVHGAIITINDYYLGKILSGLPEEKRNLILMYYCLGMKQREIGEVIGKARQTVGKRNLLSLKQLKADWEFLHEKE